MKCPSCAITVFLFIESLEFSKIIELRRRTVGGYIIEVVDIYLYLEHTVKLGKCNFEKESYRRIRLGWQRF